MQPVGHVLAGDPQGGAILHQAHVIDVRHLGTADPLVDPAHHIAKQALDVVVQLLLHGLGLPVGGPDGGLQQVRQVRRLAALQTRLHLCHIHPVIVQGVQGGGGGGGDPGRVGPGAGMGDLVPQHGLHLVRRRPHALADLGMADKAGGDADLDVARLVGGQPGLRLHLRLPHHGAQFHVRMDLVPGAVEEAGIDEHHPVPGRMDAGAQVGAGAALLVHDADLDGVAGQTQGVLDPVEQANGQRHLVRPVHLRLHHIDGAGGAVGPGPAQVVQGAGHGDQGVDDGLVDRLPVQQGRIAQHVVAHIADQQHGAALQHLGLAVATGIGAVRVQATGQDLSALVEGLGQVALHQAEPGAIDAHLVLRIHGGDGILAVLDGGQGAFHQKVADPGGVVPADVARAVDDDLHMQPVVAEQHAVRGTGIAAPSGQHLGMQQAGLPAIDQADPQQAIHHRIAGGILVAGPVQGGDLVQEGPGMGDDLGPALDVIGTGGQDRGQGIGAVEGVVQAAPPGIGGIQGIAGIGQGHHQLRSGSGGDLGIDPGGADPEVGHLLAQIADLPQEPRLLHHIHDLAPPGGPVGVELGLQPVPDGQQRRIARAEVRCQMLQRRPEGRRGDVEAGQHLGLHELPQDRIGNEAGGHRDILQWNEYGQVGGPTMASFCIFSQSR